MPSRERVANLPGTGLGRAVVKPAAVGERARAVGASEAERGGPGALDELQAGDRRVWWVEGDDVGRNVRVPVERDLASAAVGVVTSGPSPDAVARRRDRCEAHRCAVVEGPGADRATADPRRRAGDLARARDPRLQGPLPHEL